MELKVLRSTLIFLWQPLSEKLVFPRLELFGDGTELELTPEGAVFTIPNLDESEADVFKFGSGKVSVASNNAANISAIVKKAMHSIDGMRILAAGYNVEATVGPTPEGAVQWLNKTFICDKRNNPASPCASLLFVHIHEENHYSIRFEPFVKDEKFLFLHINRHFDAPERGAEKLAEDFLEFAVNVVPKIVKDFVSPDL